LGNRFERYTKEKPEWMPQQAIENARITSKLANKYKLSLPSLAHRFILSLQEVDHMVLGAKNMAQLQATLNDCSKGKLEEALFNTIIGQIQ